MISESERTSPRDKLRHSGFVAVRTPLLPFEEIERWSTCPPAEGGSGSAADDRRAALEAGLARLWRRAEVREAVGVSSHSALREIDSAGSRKGYRTLATYFTRMASRCTPFGISAGVSVVPIRDDVRGVDVRLAPRAEYRRQVRPDLGYLDALARLVAHRPQMRERLVYRPNDSLHRVGDRLHYVECHVAGTARSYHLVAVEDGLELWTVLERARNGARLAELGAELGCLGVDGETARDFVDQLVDAQLLLPALQVPVTGDAARDALVAELRAVGADDEARVLEDALDYLEALNERPLGVDPAACDEVTRRLAGLVPDAAEDRILQVDLAKPARGAIGDDIVTQVIAAVELLFRIDRPGRDALQSFRERFMDRYEGAEIPLLQALDPETGVGFEDEGAVAEPLLATLDPTEPPPAREWTRRDQTLLRRVIEATSAEATEMLLDDVLLAALAPASPSRLPPSGSAFVRLGRNGAGFQILLQGVGGPPGARLLGRFCYGDPDLAKYVREHCRAEEVLYPGAIIAEIVHLPEGRLGNILARPVLREREIVFLGRSGAAPELQIAVDDLTVSVRGSRVVLRSRRLNREVIPRLTSAHNFTRQSLAIYRFLCTLQDQDGGGAGWSWGPLADAPFLPRVRRGNVVLSRATWNVEADELRPLRRASNDERPHLLRAWRDHRRIPRCVALAEADQELYVDFENSLLVDAFLHASADQERVRLFEMFPDPDDFVVHGPEGRFASEVIIPFTRETLVATSIAPSAGLTKRVHPPGSEWLYAKLYVGEAAADRVLLDRISPLVAGLWETGMIDSWFFLRYADPEPHLRLRFRGEPERLTSEVLPELAAMAQEGLDEGAVGRFALDTYVREVERYGGDEGIILAEELFCADSEAAVAILRALRDESDAAAWRWKLALCGIDTMLSAFGLDGVAADWTAARRDAYAREFAPSKTLRRQLGERFRQERGSLEGVLRLAHSVEGDEYPALVALRRRNGRFAAVGAAFGRLERAGRLTFPFAEVAASVAHLHVNRMLRSRQRFQEYVLFELLSRLRHSKLARGESAGGRPVGGGR